MSKDINVVIVGMGKAGLIHYNCYMKAQRHSDINLNVVALVDPQIHEREIDTSVFNPHLLTSFKSLPSLLGNRPVVVDVCAPNRSHYEIVLSTKMLAKPPFIIVEKPLCLTQREVDYLLNNYPSLFVAENYLYSKVTAEIRGVIERLDLKPYSLETKFTKNRVADTLRGRGYSRNIQSPPHAFEIEMPHQLAVALLLMGDINSVESSVCYPMKTNKGLIAKHGAGRLVVKHVNGSISKHWTSLQDPYTIRMIKVKCKNNMVIIGEYSCDQTLTGRIQVIEDDIILEDFKVFDDSIRYTLENAIRLGNGYRQKNRLMLQENRHIASNIVKCLEEAIKTNSY